MTHPAVHWPTLSPETHFQRSVRCFPQRPRSLHALLDNAVALNPQGTALVCNDTRLTYLALNEQVARLAAGWHALGLNAGDRVALLLSWGWGVGLLDGIRLIPTHLERYKRHRQEVCSPTLLSWLRLKRWPKNLGDARHLASAATN